MRWFVTVLMIMSGSVFCAIAQPVSIGGFSIEPPAGWVNETNMSGVLLISKDPHLTTDASDPDAPPFQNNLVITEEQAGGKKSQLFQRDALFYMQVLLHNMHPEIELQEIRKKTINGFEGVYIVSSLSESGLDVMTLQFYMLHSGRLYGIAFTSLAKDAQKNRSMLEQSLHSIKNKD